MDVNNTKQSLNDLNAYSKLSYQKNIVNQLFAQKPESLVALGLSVSPEMIKIVQRESKSEKVFLRNDSYLEIC